MDHSLTSHILVNFFQQHEGLLLFQSIVEPPHDGETIFLKKRTKRVGCFGLQLKTMSAKDDDIMSLMSSMSVSASYNRRSNQAKEVPNDEGNKAPIELMSQVSSSTL